MFIEKGKLLPKVQYYLSVTFHTFFFQTFYHVNIFSTFFIVIKRKDGCSFFFFMPYHVTINALPTGAVIKSDRIHFEKFSDLLYASLPCHVRYRAGAVFCFLLYILVARTLPVFCFSVVLPCQPCRRPAYSGYRGVYWGYSECNMFAAVLYVTFYSFFYEKNIFLIHWNIMCHYFHVIYDEVLYWYVCS